MAKKRYSGWFLADGAQVLGMTRAGDETLLKRPKRGVPNGAVQFMTEHAARCELTAMQNGRTFPLWAPNARAVQLTWS